MWKTKALYVLESMDENMLDIVNDGPHQPMYQPMKDRVADGPKNLHQRIYGLQLTSI